MLTELLSRIANEEIEELDLSRERLPGYWDGDVIAYERQQLKKSVTAIMPIRDGLLIGLSNGDIKYWSFNARAWQIDFTKPDTEEEAKRNAVRYIGKVSNDKFIVVRVYDICFYTLQWRTPQRSFRVSNIRAEGRIKTATLLSSNRLVVASEPRPMMGFIIDIDAWGLVGEKITLPKYTTKMLCWPDDNRFIVADSRHHISVYKNINNRYSIESRFKTPTIINALIRLPNNELITAGERKEKFHSKYDNNGGRYVDSVQCLYFDYELSKIQCIVDNYDPKKKIGDGQPYNQKEIINAGVLLPDGSIAVGGSDGHMSIWDPWKIQPGYIAADATGSIQHAIGQKDKYRFIHHLAALEDHLVSMTKDGDMIIYKPVMQSLQPAALHYILHAVIQSDKVKSLNLCNTVVDDNVMKDCLLPLVKQTACLKKIIVDIAYVRDQMEVEELRVICEMRSITCNLINSREQQQASSANNCLREELLLAGDTNTDITAHTSKLAPISDWIEAQLTQKEEYTAMLEFQELINKGDVDKVKVLLEKDINISFLSFIPIYGKNKELDALIHAKQGIATMQQLMQVIDETLAKRFDFLNWQQLSLLGSNLHFLLKAWRATQLRNNEYTKPVDEEITAAVCAELERRLDDDEEMQRKFKKDQVATFYRLYKSGDETFLASTEGRLFVGKLQQLIEKDIAEILTDDLFLQCCREYSHTMALPAGLKSKLHEVLIKSIEITKKNKESIKAERPHTYKAINQRRDMARKSKEYDTDTLEDIETMYKYVDSSIAQDYFALSEGDDSIVGKIKFEPLTSSSVEEIEKLLRNYLAESVIELQELLSVDMRTLFVNMIMQKIESREESSLKTQLLKFIDNKIEGLEWVLALGEQLSKDTVLQAIQTKKQRKKQLIIESLRDAYKILDKVYSKVDILDKLKKDDDKVASLEQQVEEQNSVINELREQMRLLESRLAISEETAVVGKRDGAEMMQRSPKQAKVDSAEMFDMSPTNLHEELYDPTEDTLQESLNDEYEEEDSGVMEADASVRLDDSEVVLDSDSRTSSPVLAAGFYANKHKHVENDATELHTSAALLAEGNNSYHSDSTDDMDTADNELEQQADVDPECRL